MALSAGRRRVASPFARRAEAHAANVEDTPDISTVPEPENKSEPENKPEIVDEQPEADRESTVEPVENDAVDEAQEPNSDEGTADSSDKPKRGRGRPRSAEVKHRDARVLEWVVNSDGQTRSEIEEALELTESETYMSLFRLRKEGQIERRRVDGKHRWFKINA